jgi:hypothetical protein
MNQSPPPMLSGISSGMPSPHVRLLSRAEQSRVESSALPYRGYITLVKGVLKAARFWLNATC